MSQYSFIDLKELFHTIDEDGDGKISKKELTKMIKTLNLSPSKDQIDAMFMAGDKDGMYN